MTARRASSSSDEASRDRGAVIPFVAICLVLIIASAALSVDIGRLSVTGRETRTVADIAALDAVRVIDDQPTLQQEAPVRAVAVESAARNGFEDGVDGDLVVTLGQYDPATRVFTPTTAVQVPNAVRVDAQRENDNLFAPGSFTVDRSATASKAATGMAGVGIATATVVVDTTQSLVLNALLGDVLGTSINLTAAQWSTLANTNVTLGELASLGVGLAPTQVDQLLNRVWSVGGLIDALATTLVATPAGTLLANQLNIGPDPLTLQLRDIIEANLTSPGAHELGLSVLDLLQAAAQASGQGNVITVNLGASIAGLASVAVQLQVVEPPQYEYGPVGTTAQSAQVRATVLAATPPISVLGLATASVGVPLVIDTGRGQATITSITCGTGRAPDSVGISATTAAATVRVAQPSGPIGSGGYAPATILDVTVPLPLLPPLLHPHITATANIAIPVAQGSGSLSFSPTYGWTPTQKVSSSADPSSVLALDPAAMTPASLVVNIEPLGGLDLNGVLGFLVNDALNPVITALVPPLLHALGVDLGIADISVPAASCQQGSLVQ